MEEWGVYPFGWISERQVGVSLFHRNGGLEFGHPPSTLLRNGYSCLGGKSGFIFIGVSGPGMDDREVCLHTVRKHWIVGLISGWESISGGL